MRISLRWLAEYVPLPPPEDLARRLTGVGLEVEAVERVGGGLEGVVAARILSAEKHPAADRLSVVRVDAGAEPLQIVCGATNWNVGDVVPLATVGTTLPGGLRIERASLRGVESSGMLCSAKELGLSSDASGLLVLPPGVAPGAAISEALALEDVLFEVNVTPNRPDALSHVGIAREVAAITGRSTVLPQPGLSQKGGPASEAVKVRIEAPARCARYAARVVEGVRIGPSPLWLARRLESCGVRSISNVVDATNYVLLELGHPLHAFDLDKVAGSEIVVRAARPGETLTTLDGQERPLDPDDLVIADRDRASALAGVMGGGASEISAGTSRVLVESAWFEPAGVRRTSRRHGLHTEASHRFERGADPGMVLRALDRCAALVAGLSGGAVRRGVVDAHPRRHRPVQVPLAWSRPAEVLGMPVSRKEARRILGALGFEERKAGPAGALYRVPSWRPDVAREEDLIEEIVRLKGYDSIPEHLPPIANPNPSLPPEAQALARAREALEAEGFSEAVNFSFVAPQDLAPLGDDAPRAVPLRNPISADLALMRTSLVPSLLRNAAHNLRQRVGDVRLYEVAHVYGVPGPGPGDDEPAAEDERLGGVALGRRSPAGWAAGADAVDFHDVKAAIERLLEGLGVAGARWRNGGPGWLHPRSAATLEIPAGGGPEPAGFAGEIHPRAAAAFDLPAGAYAFELRLAPLLARARLVMPYRGVPRFPAVLRDLAVVVDEATAAQEVLALVREEALVEDATLFDVYRGPPIPEGRKNLAMAIRYRAADRTLTDAEADAAHARIVDRLRGSGAELRA